MFERVPRPLDRPHLDITMWELLGAWREAERMLRSTPRGTPEYQSALRVAQDARELYGERFDQIAGRPGATG